MKKILDMKAKFTWFWSDRFFVETELKTTAVLK